MATTVTTDPTEVANAANFLEQFLSDNDPSGDFSRGTALRDHTVGALAAIFAFLRADATQIRQLQSLTSVQEATGGDPEALRDAVIAILSNVFIAPKSGSKSRGMGIGHASQQVDLFIQPTHRFFRTSSLLFVVDSTETYFIPATDLVPVVDAANVVLEYQFRIPLVAVRTGVAYDVDPGQFADFDKFNPYITRIENLDKFSGGKAPETVEEILARAPTAIAVRNLINERSITAVLDENFAEIRGLFVAGMGAPEMQRDLIELASHISIHVGGAADIYPLMDLAETTTTGAVGGFFTKPDGIVNIFRDPVRLTFPGTVFAGDILRIYAGIPNAPREFKILENRTSELIVSERTPFPVATDELVPPGAAEYTIGRIAPAFNDLVSDLGGIPYTSGVTTRRVQAAGRITMPAGPVMDILDVAITDPAAGEGAFKSAIDGFVHFPNQVNQAPSQAQTPAQGLQYQVIIHNPDYAQSEKMWMEIVVGTDSVPTRFDGYTLRVRYRTLSGFASVDAFVVSPGERTVAASQLVRGHNPVSLQINISYKLKSTALTVLDNSVIAQKVVDYINSFDTTATPIDTSAISDVIRTNFPTIASVLPLTITYVLFAPTGEIVTYETVDEVRIEAAKQTAGPVLDLLRLGLTNRNTRYLANIADITATLVT